jgi:Flp pilus assembly pilin Flp
MKRLMTRIKKVARRETGASMVEYAIGAGFLAAFLVAPESPSGFNVHRLVRKG